MLCRYLSFLATENRLDFEERVRERIFGETYQGKTLDLKVNGKQKLFG